MTAGREIPRSTSWHLSAQPNPWDAGLAFDGNNATRWSSWQNMSPGMFVSVSLNQPELVDSIVLQVPTTYPASYEVKVLADDGQWKPWPSMSVVQAVPAPPDLRWSATRAIAARGVQYLLIRDNDFPGADLKRNPAGWGVRLVGEVGDTRLYHIED